MTTSRQRKYPLYICHDCGTKFCDGIKGEPTYHLGDCDCCGAQQVPCTEPRDYGGFKEWPLPREIDPRAIPESVLDLVEPVIKEFDFKRVRQAMVALDWKWALLDGFHVPTIENLQQKARYLLEEVAKTRTNIDRTIGTGGLWAQKIDDGLVLRFIVEETELYLEDFD